MTFALGFLAGAVLATVAPFVGAMAAAWVHDWNLEHQR